MIQGRSKCGRESIVLEKSVEIHKEDNIIGPSSMPS